MFNGHRVSVLQDDKILDMVSGSDCTMISMDLMTLNCTLESGENGKLYATITQIFFKNLMTIYHR